MLVEDRVVAGIVEIIVRARTCGHRAESDQT
jgi:hypothetical protein